MTEHAEGCFGWRLDGSDRLSLGSAEPTKLAIQMHGDWRRLMAEKGVQRLKSEVQKIQMTCRWEPATDAQIVRVLSFMWSNRPRAAEHVGEVLNYIVSEGEITNDGLFQRLAGDLGATLDLAAMSDLTDMRIYPPIWACIANLDEMTLEVYSVAYSSGPMDAAALGRYCAHLVRKDMPHSYPLVLIVTSPIADDLPSNWAERAELAANMLRGEIPEGSSAHARIEAARFVAKYGPPETARMLYERAVELGA
jgi:hypothetical protein